MKKIDIELKNCYGIKALKCDFDFSKKSTYVIYAPNGIMKTSFAKTFLDLSKGEKSKDSIFTGRKTKREITDENKKELSKEDVFVILPYDQDYRSEKISTLLVNSKLKKAYEAIYKSIEEKKDSLLKALKPLTGLKSEVEETFTVDFTHEAKDFFKAFLRVKAEVQDKSEPVYDNIIYDRLFNEKVDSFLGTKDFKAKLAEYIKIYNELIDASTYFKKGIFNHNNAAAIAKNLKDNGFFKANHTVALNGKEKRTITTEAELEEVIQHEKDNILKNPDLLKAFEEIDKKITANVELRSFRDYIEKNQTIIPELLNVDALRQKLWIAYLKKNKEAFQSLDDEYSKGQKEIEAIVEQAKKEETEWRKVIEEFNRRFFVPFEIFVDNQDDVILKSAAPSIKFVFKDGEEEEEIEEEELFQVLSGGELRALYILNIIFEVEARKQSDRDTLFIVDDIADSFDYKNKYAIIEYLKDISREGNFNQIILTHNFDFYRTICGRLDMEYTHKLHTVKTPDGVNLVKEKYQNSPFKHWKNNFHKDNNEAMLIASIPFVRNLAEYSGYEDHYKGLTSLLHIKENTNTITIKDLQEVYKEILKDKQELLLMNPSKKILDLIFEITETIISNPSEVIDLENKIVLAIAIRLKAESFMISRIHDEAFIRGISTNQTFALFQKFIELFGELTSHIKILEEVNLMTPENIHLNSFMYEPILDMSNDHLKKLYIQVRDLK